MRVKAKHDSSQKRLCFHQNDYFSPFSKHKYFSTRLRPWALDDVNDDRASTERSRFCFTDSRGSRKSTTIIPVIGTEVFAPVRIENVPGPSGPRQYHVGYITLYR